MRFMMLMIPLGYETAPPDVQLDPERVKAMMKYNEALKDAGVLIALDGLHPPSMGARVSFATGKPVVTDGPFTEAKEVLGGYWMIDVKSREEAIAWAKKCPASENEIIEIRQVQEMADFSEEVQQAAEGFAELQKGMRTRRGELARLRTPSGREYRQSVNRKGEEPMSTNDTFLAVFLGSKTSAKMAAWNALPEAERRAKEQQGIAAWKAWVEKHQAAIVAMGGPLGKTKRVDSSGIADIANEMGAFTVVRAALPRGRRETVREPPAFCDLPRRARGDHAGAPDPGRLDRAVGTVRNRARTPLILMNAS